MDPRQYSLAAEIREVPDRQTHSDASDRGAEYHHARGFTHRKNNDYASAIAEVRHGELFWSAMRPSSVQSQ
jgi:hypothetical protein